MLFGILNTSYQSQPHGSNHIYQFVHRSGFLTGTVQEAEYKADNQYQEVILSAQYFQEQNKRYSTKGKVLLRIYGEGASLQNRDLIKARIVLQEPILPGNFGEFNYREYLTRKNIFVIGSINIDQVDFMGRGKQFDSSYYLNYLKDKVEKNIDKIYHYPYSALIKAIAIGKRTEIPPEWEPLFQDAGIMHILAISGLHVGIVTAALIYILKLLPIFKRTNLSYFIVIIFLLGYAALTGFRPSVSRATIMFITILLARYLNRPYHPYNSLYLAALILLFYQPLILFDAGFLLSFTVTFFIIFLYPIIKEQLGFLPYSISKPLAVSSAAWLGMSPLSAYYFYKISYIAIFSNLVIVPLISIILILGLISGIFSFIFLSWAGLIALLNQIFVKILIYLASMFSSLPFAYQYIAQPQLYQIIYYYSIIFLIVYSNSLWSKLSMIKKKKLFWTITISVVTYLLIQFIFSSNLLSVHFINVGQGDSILIQTPYKQNILIDGGGTPFNDFDIGQQIVIPYLRRLGINRIDLLVLTHPDIDHLEGLLPVLREIKVNMVIDSGITNQHNAYLAFISLIKKDENITYYQARADDIIRLGPDLEILVLNSLNLLAYGNESNFNNHSIVLKLLYKNTGFLFTGDIEEIVEIDLLSQKDLLRSDILKVAHHGSITSSTELFMEKVQPKVAIISVGLNNFNHPHEEVVKRLKDQCQQVFRTDRNGTVLISSNGQKYYINTLR